MSEETLGHGAAADIACANEKNGLHADITV
jgi:hypothetical protein